MPALTRKRVNDRPETWHVEAARVAFEAAWRDFLPKRSEADFQAWRDQEAWTAEKYRRFARHERMPPVLAGDG